MVRSVVRALHIGICIEACIEASGTGDLGARYSGAGVATENVGRRSWDVVLMIKSGGEWGLDREAEDADRIVVCALVSCRRRYGQREGRRWERS